MFAAEIQKRRVGAMRSSNLRWHLDVMVVKNNGERRYLWRTDDDESEVRENYVSKRRDRNAALKFLRKAMKRFGPSHVIVTDLMRSFREAMRVICNGDMQKTGRWLSNRAGNSREPFQRRERAMRLAEKAEDRAEAERKEKENARRLRRVER